MTAVACGNEAPPISAATAANAQASLRKALLTRRRRLRQETCRRTAAAIDRYVRVHPWFVQARYLAAYLPFGNEVATEAIIAAAWALHKRVYLPVVYPGTDCRLGFRRYTPHTPLRRNALGVLEPCPDRQPILAPCQFDLVLTPLVGFDATGHRLGMGGGCYDRAFAFLLRRHYWRRPRLLGLAYAWQQVPALPIQPWDAGLDGVMTELGWQRYGY